MSAHFIERVRERAPEGVDAKALRTFVQRAVTSGIGIDRLFDGVNGCGVFRIMLDGAPYYVVADDRTGEAVTFMAQEQFRAVRAMMRGKAKNIREVRLRGFVAGLPPHRRRALQKHWG